MNHEEDLMIEETLTEDLDLESIEEEDQVPAHIKEEMEDVEVHHMITVRAFQNQTLDFKNYAIFIF